LEEWINHADSRPPDFLFPGRIKRSNHLSRRQDARIVNRSLTEIGLDSALYGTLSLRRTKASLIYRKTKNLREVQLLLGHTRPESTVRYLGID
jgi:integrase